MRPAPPFPPAASLAARLSAALAQRKLSRDRRALERMAQELDRQEPGMAQELRALLSR